MLIRDYMCIPGDLEDYWRRKRVLQTPTEIVEVLKVLIFHDEVQDPLVYDGTNRQMVSIEMFLLPLRLSFIVRYLESFTQFLNHVWS